MASLRMVRESPVEQGTDEEIAYKFDFAAIGTPTSPTVTLYDMTVGANAPTKLSGSASVATTFVTTPAVISLTAGSQYKLQCLATVDGNKVSNFVIINAE
jgi:hypothetical protein